MSKRDDTETKIHISLRRLSLGRTAISLIKIHDALLQLEFALTNNMASEHKNTYTRNALYWFYEHLAKAIADMDEEEREALLEYIEKETDK